ncbi:MAG: ISL3 family transposase, partial [Metallibacterium scheffleri]
MDNTLFSQALGLTAPWQVSNVDFRQAEAAIHFQVICDARRLPCPACSAADQPIHDRIARTWQHLHFFQFRAYIHAELPRVACGRCGKISQVEVPWSRKGSGFSLTMEAFIVALCREMPALVVARLLGVSDGRVWRVLEHHVQRARAQADHTQVRRIAVDERSARRGQRFLTLFHDADQRRLLFATPGRDGQTFAAFAADLTAHSGDAKAIETVSLDMSKAYQAGARQHCPQATLSFDPFHVVALAHTALEEVRRAETKTRPELKGSRWATLKDASRWSERQLTLMHHLQRSGLQTARAWRLKEALRTLFAQTRGAEDAERELIAWISWARRSRLKPFKRLGATLRQHLAGLVEHFRSGLSNGFVEAMNGQIQAAKARARGYRTDRCLITISYLICGKLKHLPSNPWIPSSV